MKKYQNGIILDVVSVEHNDRFEVVWSRRADLITQTHLFCNTTVLYLNAFETYLDGHYIVSVFS